MTPDPARFVRGRRVAARVGALLALLALLAGTRLPARADDAVRMPGQQGPHGSAAGRAVAADPDSAEDDSLVARVRAAAPAPARANPDTLLPDSLRAIFAAAPARLVHVATPVGGGPQRGDLLEPAAVTIDAFGRMFVADAASHRLWRFDANGVPTGQAGALGSDPNELRRPAGIALLGTLTIAVLDVENRRIVAFDLDARPQGTLVDFDAVARDANLGRIEPRALASDRGGALYVVDSERDRVLTFDRSGAFVRALGGFGAGAGSFRELAGVAATRRAQLVTTERGSRRVQRLDAGGAPQAAWRLPGAVTPGALAVAVDDSLRIAVADERAGTVTVWSGDGAPLAARGGFDRPRALAFAPDGTLVVAEAGARRIVRYRLEPRREP